MCRLTISALKPAHRVAALPVPALYQEQGGNINRVGSVCWNRLSFKTGAAFCVWHNLSR